MGGESKLQRGRVVGGVSNQSGCVLCADVCHSSMFVHILTPCLILLHKHLYSH